MKYKTEKNTILLGIIAVLLIILIAVFFSQKKSSLKPAGESSSSEEAQTQITISSAEEGLGEITLPKVEPEKQTTTASESKALKLLNTNAVAVTLRDDQGNKMAGLRILGEVQNISNQVVEKATIMVKFYGEKETLLATKTGTWNQGYKFLSLAPGEINVYDVLIAEPPASESISIGIKSDRTDKSNRSARLEIKGEKLEGAVSEKGGQQISYFKFTGTLVNNNEFEVISPGVYVWIEDDKDKVIGSSYQTFSDKTLTKGQELDVALDLLPISPESKIAYHTRGRAFAERL